MLQYGILALGWVAGPCPSWLAMVSRLVVKTDQFILG
jgi:hypothetical protein